jgi:lipoate-protein ligase A
MTDHPHPLHGLVHPTEPRLAIASGEREEVVLGQFQRARSALRLDEVAARGLTVTRRTSGGPAVLFGPGSLHVALSLPRPDALVSCTPRQLVNRYVRPLLRGLGRLGCAAHYFGRDWVTAAKRPVAWIGYAELGDGRSWVEALVAVQHRFDLPSELDGYPARQNDWFLGKAPITLEDVLGRSVSADEVQSAITGAYHAAFGELGAGTWTHDELRPEVHDERPAWDAVIEEAIGFIGASAAPSPGVGGDFLAGAEVVEALTRAMTELGPAPSDDAIASAIQRAVELGTMEGMKDHGSIARAMREAFRVAAARR